MDHGRGSKSPPLPPALSGAELRSQTHSGHRRAQKMAETLRRREYTLAPVFLLREGAIPLSPPGIDATGTVNNQLSY